MCRFALQSFVAFMATWMSMHFVVVANAEDAESLNGSWIVVVAMMGGKPIKDAVGHTAVFRDGVAVQEDIKGRESFSGTFKCDTSVDPATIDVLDNQVVVNRGVYVQRGDSLEICWGFGKRPQSLDSAKDRTYVYFMFARKGR